MGGGVGVWELVGCLDVIEESGWGRGVCYYKWVVMVCCVVLYGCYFVVCDSGKLLDWKCDEFGSVNVYKEKFCVFILKMVVVVFGMVCDWIDFVWNGENGELYCFWFILRIVFCFFYDRYMCLLVMLCGVLCVFVLWCLCVVVRWLFVFEMYGIKEVCCVVVNVREIILYIVLFYVFVDCNCWWFVVCL